MKLWKLLFFIAVIILLVYGVFLSFLNYDLLKTPVLLAKGRSIQVGSFILLAFLAGFILMGFRFLVEAWRRDREGRAFRRKNQETERNLDLLILTAWSRLNGETALPEGLFKKPAGQPHPLLDFLTLSAEAGDDNASRVEQMRALVSRYPETPALRIILINDLIAAGKTDEAEKSLEEDPLPSNLSSYTLFLQRNLEIARKNWKTCVALQKKIIPLFPSRDEEKRLLVGCHYEVAKALAEAGESKSALTMLRSLQRDYPSFAPAWVLTGDIHEKASEQEKALEVWREGFMKTRAVIFLHRISDSFLNHEQPEKAIEALTQIAYESDEDIVARFFLGRFYYRLEMHEEALREFSIIRPHVSRSPTLNFLMGSLEEKMNHPEKAVSALKKALSELTNMKYEYVCLTCSSVQQKWVDRCPECGSWNTVVVDYLEEKARPKDLGLELFPIRFPVRS